MEIKERVIDDENVVFEAEMVELVYHLPTRKATIRILEKLSKNDLRLLKKQLIRQMRHLGVTENDFNF